MTIPVPDHSRLSALSEHYGFGLDEAELAEFQPAVAGTLGASERVAQLYARTAPVVPDREYRAPSENPLGAWAVRTSISGSATGPLAGRSVVIKDNVAVAGVPMANGSSSVEGFVPARDATVVTRLLEAGATLGRELHVVAGTGAQPVGPRTQRGWLVERQRRPGGERRCRPRGGR